jgi:hypothetical protein
LIGLAAGFKSESALLVVLVRFGGKIGSRQPPTGQLENSATTQTGRCAKDKALPILAGRRFKNLIVVSVCQTAL